MSSHALRRLERKLADLKSNCPVCKGRMCVAASLKTATAPRPCKRCGSIPPVLLTGVERLPEAPPGSSQR